MKLSRPQSVPDQKIILISGIYGPTIDRDGLPGDEVALPRGKKNERAEKVFGIGIALERAALDRRLPGRANMAGIALLQTVAQGQTGSESIDADAVLAELARERPRERHHGPLRGDVMQHPRDAAKRRARTDIDDLTVAFRLHMRSNVLGHQERAADIHRHDPVPQRHVDV